MYSYMIFHELNLVRMYDTIQLHRKHAVIYTAFKNIDRGNIYIFTFENSLYNKYD